MEERGHANLNGIEEILFSCKKYEYRLSILQMFQTFSFVAEENR